jgi:hypothetical protein
MAHFRVVSLGQGAEHLWAIERIDDEGTAAMLRQRFKAKHEAEAESLRLNLSDAEKDA